jgi:Protein of unknown function (DUF3631)
VLYTLIELEHPTLLIDEIDRLYERKDTSAVTAILNSGFERGAKVPRVGFDKDGNRTIERYDVFGPVIIAGIDKGYLPDTLDDRLIEIRLQKNTGPEKPEYDPVLVAAETAELRRRFEKFAEEIRGKVRTAEPYIPPGIRDRYKNKWKTLFIVADGMDDCDRVTNVTGSEHVGLCGYKTRQAALNLLKEQQEKEAEQTDYSVMVVHHIDEIFELLNKKELPITTILDQLNNTPEAPGPHSSTTSRSQLTGSANYYYPVHMLGTMRLHNASFPPGRTSELCLDFFAAVATLNSLRDAILWGFLTSFQTSSSGLISGEYGGRKNSRRRSFTWCRAACDLTFMPGRPGGYAGKPQLSA